MSSLFHGGTDKGARQRLSVRSRALSLKKEGKMDWHFWAWVIVAFWIGSLFGFFLFAIIAAGSDDDESDNAYCLPTRQNSMTSRPGGPWMTKGYDE